MQLTSTAFADGATIAKPFTGDGQDQSPPLRWTDGPPNTKSYALIVDDPDAPVGTWVHWVLFNIPADCRELSVDAAKKGLPQGSKQGKNDFKKLAYGGPAPPRGKPHRYFFKIYALDATLDLPEGATKKEVEPVMQGHVLAHGQLMGTYER
jgi:Raf kinase inhibitor-like YbhB/YbcL family protein